MPCQASVGEGAGCDWHRCLSGRQGQAQNTKLLFAAPHLMTQLPSQAHSRKERWKGSAGISPEPCYRVTVGTNENFRKVTDLHGVEDLH